MSSKKGKDPFKPLQQILCRIVELAFDVMIFDEVDDREGDDGSWVKKILRIAASLIAIFLVMIIVFKMKNLL